MNALLSTLVAFVLAASIGSAQAQTEVPSPAAAPPPADLRYAKRVEPRFLGFAGSSENLSSIATGMRHGSEFTITGGGESATIVPPTKPMGYGNITRALDFANRDLAAAGITNPTPSQIGAALNGGTVTGPNGDVTMQGVLKLRSEGMGWGQVAHSLDLHPGLGSAKTAPPVPATSPAPARSSSGITTALGSRVVQPGARQGTGASTRAVSAPGNAGGAVTAAGGRASANGAARGQYGHGRSGKI